MRYAFYVLREAASSAIAQKVTSLLVIVVVAAMCSTVNVTVGKTVAAKDSIVGSLDSAGTRSIIVRADPEAGVTTAAIDRVATVDGLEFIAGFGPAVDTRNTLLSGGPAVPVRDAYGPSLDQLVGAAGPVPEATYVSANARDELGLTAAAGSVRTPAGLTLPIVGSVDQEQVGAYLGFLEPIALTRAPDTGSEPLTVLVIIATDPSDVGDVGDAVLPLLGASDPTKVTIQTSARLAELRNVIDNQLGGFSTRLVVGAFVITGVLVACLLTGLILLRRRDFGRRRALGATRGLIVALVLGQVGLCSVIGAIVGCAGSGVYLATRGGPVPSLTYSIAVGVCAVAVAAIAATTPALVAASRDPLHELRVP